MVVPAFGDDSPFTADEDLALALALETQ